VTDPLGIACDHEHGCITCGDEAVPMRVVRVDAARALALCEDAAGVRSSVEIGLVDPVSGGDRLLVHAGTALHLIERPDAERSSQDAGPDALRRTLS
jgi:hydrogenase assembly chaperone HypC/HupF